MLEKPALEDSQITACLRDDYGLRVTRLDFLPIGNDASAWAYEGKAGDGQAYFLKLTQRPIYPPGMVIPRYLSDSGIQQVVAPICTRTGGLWQAVDGYTLVVYPFIDGKTGMDIGLSDTQWIELGTALKAIHTTSLPLELKTTLRKETFVPPWGKLVRQLLAEITRTDYDDVFQRELAAFWLARRDDIVRIVDRTERLGHLIQKQPPSLALCHADIHTANVLIDRASRLFIVDWDGILLAPVERDLMFVVGDVFDGVPVESRSQAVFLKGYGPIGVDPLVLAYYRYEWVVQEIGDFAERVFLARGTGEATRRDAVRGFRQLFDPDDVVEQAYGSGGPEDFRR